MPGIITGLRMLLNTLFCQKYLNVANHMKPQFVTTLFDPDATSCPAVARHLDFIDYEAEVPVHTHRKGQLIIALYGAVICRAENDIWIVPPNCAVWIPGDVPHSAKATRTPISIICLLNPAPLRFRKNVARWRFHP